MLFLLESGIIAKRGTVLILRKLGIKGFTLIEVIIVLMVLGVGLTPLIYFLSTGTSINRDVKDKAVATNLARESMEMYRNEPYTDLLQFAPITTESQVSNFPDYSREVKFTQVQVGLYQVDVIVKWFNNKRDVKIVTYRADY